MEFHSVLHQPVRHDKDENITVADHNDMDVDIETGEAVVSVLKKINHKFLQILPYFIVISGYPII